MQEPSPRVDDLAALLRDLDALRLTVSTDMSLAAAALDAGAPDVAGSVVDGDRAALLAFEQRALRHLAKLEEQASTPEPALPVLPRPRQRSRAARTLLPAGPLLAAAAALLGVLGATLPTAGADEVTTRPASARTAAASYAELQRLTLDGADDARVRRAAERLQSELEGIVAAAATDPVAAQQALALLEQEAGALDGLAGQDALSQVIADVRALVARLKAALPPAPRTPRAPAVSQPGVRTLSTPAVPEPMLLPAAPEPSAKPSPQPEPSPEASEEAKPEPSPEQASPSPSTAPSGANEPGLLGLSDED